MDFDRFYFTQYSLKAFDDCPLKFKKRYIENIRWGGLPDEIVGKQIQLGKDFHLIAHRYFLGIDADYEKFNLIDDKLYKWFLNLKRAFPSDKTVNYLPEHKLRLSSGGINLEANFDLIVINNDKITIWDWKTGVYNTGTSGSISGKKLRSSLQTIIYMYVMKELGLLVTGSEIKSNNLKMRYWQPETVEVLVEIVYNDELHKSFFSTICDKINTIKSYDYNMFNKTLFTTNCKYCEFNSLCNKGQVDYSSVFNADE